MPSLFVTCRACRFDFPSGIALTGPLETLSIFGIRHRCPRCHREASYFTSEYHVAAGFELPRAPAPTLYHAGAALPTAARIDAVDPPSDASARAPFGWLGGARVVRG